MKKLLSLVLVLVFVLSLSTMAMAEGDKIIVNFWHTRKVGTAGDIIDAAIAEFNATIGAEEGIEVVGTYQGGYGDVLTKSMSAIAAGESVQVVHLERSNGVPPLWDEGVLLDMTEYVEASEVVDMDNFVEAFTGFSWAPDGTLVSLPYTRSTFLFYYNKTMFDAAGLEVPKTWDELAEVAKALTVVDATTGETTCYGFGLVHDLSPEYAFINSMGYEIFNEDGTACTALEDGSFEMMLTNWKTAIDEGWCEPYASKDAANAFASELFQGRLGSFITSSGSLGGYTASAKEAGIELGVAPLPSMGAAEDAACPVSGGNIAIIAANNDEEVQAASWKFVEFMMSDAQVAAECTGSGYMPVTKSVAEGEAFAAYCEENPNFAVAYAAVNECGRELPFSIYKPNFSPVLGAPISMLIQEGSITPAEAVDQIAEACKLVFP